MSPAHIIILGFFYYILILSLSKFAGRKSLDSEYLKTNAPAWLAVLGIVGDSISGVTYLSVPGAVDQKSYSYLAICLGYLLGYVLIALFFLPRYHKKNLVSVYEWIGAELGLEAQKISSILFVLSRIFGAAARLCLTATVLHIFLFQKWNLGVEVSILAVTFGISLYTLKSGIKSLIITDTVQSGFLVAGVLATTYYLAQFLQIQSAPLQWWRPMIAGEGVSAWSSFFKSFLSGTLITLSMTGLDQNIMQKTFSVENLKALQSNFIRLGFIVLAVNFVVLVEGSLLSQSLSFFPNLKEIPGDQRLMQLMLDSPNLICQILFFFGLSAATLNSADSVITTVTSSIKVDLFTSREIKLLPIHCAVTLFLAATALCIQRFFSDSAIELVLKSAGWTYGPLLGFFAIAAIKLKASTHSLRFALALSVFSSLVMHHYHPLGVEVIIVISLLLLFFNSIYYQFWGNNLSKEM